MSMPNVGDTLVVSENHKYFFPMKTTFTYLGLASKVRDDMFFGPNLHAVKSDDTGEVFDGLLSDTLKRFFTVVNPITENE